MIFSTRKKVLGVLILKGKENIHFPMKWLKMKYFPNWFPFLQWFVRLLIIPVMEWILFKFSEKSSKIIYSILKLPK